MALLSYVNSVDRKLSVLMNVTNPVTVTSGSSTIVYDIQRVSPELTQFANRSGGNSATMKKLSYSFSAATAARKTDKFGVDLDFPLIRVDPVLGNIANDVARIRTLLTVPEAATEAERTEIYDTLVQAIAETLFAGSVKEFDLPT